MLPEIFVHHALKALVPNLALGCISANVTVEKHNQPLWREIDQRLAHLTATIKPEQINSIPQIAAMRSAYKALGKDPSRYRGSAEALLRRVLSGKGLYQINSVVDINNLVSLESLNPAGSYDLEKITPPIELRIGAAGESYKGIGKDLINIESLPVFADARGAFGSPTSDSERAMVTLETKKILMVVFSFTGPEGLEQWTRRAAELLRQYSGGEGIETSLPA
ncbi:MAG TPA: phenylalanine--tRNA ligase beta subunit-related protein [Alphaproteobacteria bacterium]|nr:phenylalanine--tRNA ligase beta subunit-related protein [Alphaproteobacteria bacterium]